MGSFNFAQPKQFLYTQMSLKTSLWVLTLLTREATSDRVTLGVTAVLTLSAISMDSRSDLPKVSVFINDGVELQNTLGSLCYCHGLVHHMQLPLLHGLDTRVCRSSLLHQGRVRRLLQMLFLELSLSLLHQIHSS